MGRFKPFSEFGNEAPRLIPGRDFKIAPRSALSERGLFVELKGIYLRSLSFLVTAWCAKVGAANNLGVELAMKVWQDEAENVAALQHQSTGEDVGTVSEFIDCGFHPLASFGVDDVSSIEHP
jgi:hypothetical protein